jgi:putative molybdopterin biosynthesis protein
MMPLLRVDQPATLAALADPRRMAILRMLMTRRLTISQIGERLGKHPAWVRHHVLALVRAGLAALVEERTTRNYTEKYYAATASAFESHVLVTPEGDRGSTVLALGSHDLGLDILAEYADRADIGFVSVPVGSLDGLVALRQGLCDVAGCHLLDDERGEYNTPFLRHLFPDMSVVPITLAERSQGLITASGNPLGIHGLGDLTRPGIRYANRNAGSGTRVWLDARLRAEQVASDAITGYDTAFDTHTAVAFAVQRGSADVGIGLRASAESHGLHFQPLFQERFDLVMRRDRLDEPALSALLCSLESKPLRRSIGRLAGYDTSHTGEEVPRCA